MTSTIDLGEGELILIVKTGSGSFFSCAHFEKHFISKGDSVKRGDGIGLLKDNETGSSNN